VSAAAAAAPGDVLVATGTVTDTSGIAVPGAAVSLYAWPSDRVLGGLQTDQTVPTTLLATTTADSTGAYSLYVPASSLQAAAVSGTNANLEVDAGTGSRFFVVDTANPVPATANVANASNASTAVAATPTRCLEVYLHQLARDWASVGSAYIWRESPGVTGTFAYTRSQSSTLGVGLSATAAYGTFSADGTMSSSSSSTVGFPNASAGTFRAYQTQWRTALYGKVCQHHNGIVNYHARANSWLGGQNILTETSAPSTRGAYCAQYLRGAAATSRRRLSKPSPGVAA
jgi:hypothetical protein